MPLKGFRLYYALLGLMQTTTSVVVLISEFPGGYRSEAVRRFSGTTPSR